MKNFVGRHLILDVQTLSTKGIDDVNSISHLLEDLSHLLKMTLAYPPIVARFPWGNNELEKFIQELKKEGVKTKTTNIMENLIERKSTVDAGVSGISIWVESHAAIHTWTHKKFFSFDAYSCKDFDTKKALDFLLSHFEIKKYSGLDIIRTLNKPQKIKSFRG